MGRADGPPSLSRFPAPGRPGPAVRRGLAGALGGAGRLAGRRVQAPSARPVDRLEAGAAVPAALMSPPFFKPFFPFPLKSISKGLLSLSRGACGREARECGQRGGRRPGVVHGLSTRPAGRGPARRARPQAPRDPPGRFSTVVTSVLSFAPRAVRRHRGNAPGGTSRFRGAPDGAPGLLSGSVVRRSPAP